MDKIVTSIQEINLEDIRFPIIAVFEHPEDSDEICRQNI